MNIRGTIELEGDKSISIRSILFSLLSGQGSEIFNLGKSLDVKSAIRCVEHLGLSFNYKSNRIFEKKYNVKNIFDCGNSATTARLLLGILIGKKIPFTIKGDKSLSGRPMQRLINPISLMGIKIEHEHGCLPISVKKYNKIESIKYRLPIASAQLKSCIILAALGAESPTEIIENIRTRNHTEKILRMMGADIEINQKTIKVYPGQTFNRINYRVPGDISSAAFLIQFAILGKRSKIKIKNILTSKERIGFIDILKRMNASIEIKNEFIDKAEEYVGDIYAETSNLKGVCMKKIEVPSCIDEIPVLAICATQAEGQTVIDGVGELKYKESNRLNLIVNNLKKMKAEISCNEDRIIVEGGKRLYSTTIKTDNDHRIFMSFYILSLALGIKLNFDIDTSYMYSYPNFFDDIKKITS